LTPLTWGAVGLAAGPTLRLADAGAEWLTLRGRTALLRAVAALPPGPQVDTRRRDGSGWMVRIPGAGEVAR
jgi:hypothetical protein